VYLYYVCYSLFSMLIFVIILALLITKLCYL